MLCSSAEALRPGYASGTDAEELEEAGLAEEAAAEAAEAPNPKPGTLAVTGVEPEKLTRMWGWWAREE